MDLEEKGTLFIGTNQIASLCFIDLLQLSTSIQKNCSSLRGPAAYVTKPYVALSKETKQHNINSGTKSKRKQEQKWDRACNVNVQMI